MKSRSNISLSVFLSLFGFVFVGMPLISSCGKTNTVNPSTNIRYQIINLSPDLGSVDLYLNYQKFNGSSIFYPTSSGYFTLPSVITPFQIRPGSTLVPGTVVSTANLFVIDSVLHANRRYTLFIAGLANTTPDSLSYLFTKDDTASNPTTGRGKVRFINASPRSKGLDVVANGTAAFTKQLFLKPSSYLELPVGNYDFQIYPTGTTATVLSDLQNVTIQDGKLYTIYTYGLAGKADSLAFGSAVISNGVSFGVTQ